MEFVLLFNRRFKRPRMNLFVELVILQEAGSHEVPHIFPSFEESKSLPMRRFRVLTFLAKPKSIILHFLFFPIKVIRYIIFHIKREFYATLTLNLSGFIDINIKYNLNMKDLIKT